jgi:hypothetical protein
MPVFQIDPLRLALLLERYVLMFAVKPRPVRAGILHPSNAWGLAMFRRNGLLNYRATPLTSISFSAIAPPLPVSAESEVLTAALKETAIRGVLPT